MWKKKKATYPCHLATFPHSIAHCKERIYEATVKLHFHSSVDAFYSHYFNERLYNERILGSEAKAVSQKLSADLLEKG